MKIYHGTNERHLEKIRENGLQPRQTLKGNWDKFPSCANMVYLTKAYPFYFAMTAKTNKKSEKVVVIEIELNELEKDNLYPDEDFIVHVLMQERKNQESLQKIHNKVRKNLEKYKDNWALSLKNLGNICYKGNILSSSFTRICHFDPLKRLELTGMMIDPSISIMNYKFVKSKYHNLVSWMFGDVSEIEQDVATKMFFKQLNEQDKQNGIYDLMLKRKEFWDKASKDRTGIEVEVLECGLCTPGG